MTEEWDGKEIVVIVIGVIGQTGGMYLGVTTSCICSRSDGIRYRSLNRRCSRLERARRSFRANKLESLLLRRQPTGLTLLSFA